jgi:hypothetical protein
VSDDKDRTMRTIEIQDGAVDKIAKAARIDNVHGRRLVAEMIARAAEYVETTARASSWTEQAPDDDEVDRVASIVATADVEVEGWVALAGRLELVDAANLFVVDGPRTPYGVTVHAWKALTRDVLRRGRWALR